MKGKLMSLRMAVALLALILGSACAPSATTPTAGDTATVATAAPATEAATATSAPAATQIAAATATSPPTSEPTATVPQPTPTRPPTAVPEASARYRLTFEASWSAGTHPTDFPPNPHFSGLIGATHKDGIRLWEAGGTATSGIKNMAETGGKSPLDREIEALIGSGEACELISGGGIALSPGQVTVEFTADRVCPLVSVVTMIAPSPDWFVGVTGLRLLGAEGWVEEQEVELYPYDAGTDSGESYTSPDDPTAPREAIHRLEVEPLLVDGQVPPLGVFRFTRLSQ